MPGPYTRDGLARTHPLGPVNYANTTRVFWGTLFSDRWTPSPLFCRLTDSLFIHLNQSYKSIPELRNTGNTGKMEVSKVLVAQAVVAGDLEGKKLPYTFWLSFYRALWDYERVEYSVTTDSDGCELVALDIQNWLTHCVRNVMYDPEADLRNWNKLITKYDLRDPQTGIPFPLPIPRTSFPLTAHPRARPGRNQAVSSFLQSLVLKHIPAHTQFTTLITSTGAVRCDLCGSKINGIRYKCTECFDFDICTACFRKPKPKPTSNHPERHVMKRIKMDSGTSKCDVCHRTDFTVLFHCLTCPDYDECPDCNRRLKNPNASPTSPSSPLNPSQAVSGHLYWHTFLRSHVPSGTFCCVTCGRWTELVRNHCQFCADYNQCEPCRRASIPQLSDGISVPVPEPVPTPTLRPVSRGSQAPYARTAPPSTPSLLGSRPPSPVGSFVTPPISPSTPSTSDQEQIAGIGRIVSNVMGLVNFTLSPNGGTFA